MTDSGENQPPLGTCAVGSHRSPAAEQHRTPHPYNWRACSRWQPVEFVYRTYTVAGVVTTLVYLALAALSVWWSLAAAVCFASMAFITALLTAVEIRAHSGRNRTRR